MGVLQEKSIEVLEKTTFLKGLMPCVFEHSTAGDKGDKRTRKETTSQKEVSTPNTSERIAEGIDDRVGGTRKEGGRGGDHLMMGRNILGRRRGRMGQKF